VSLAAGDVLLAYSDGMSEAADAKGDEFSAERLAEVARRYQGALASELLELAEQELASFLGSAPQTDDRTLLVVRRAV
jgi:sigma-B regulation protein RsbU (phosphoserine phosphatase)